MVAKNIMRIEVVTRKHITQNLGGIVVGGKSDNFL